MKKQTIRIREFLENDELLQRRRELFENPCRPQEIKFTDRTLNLIKEYLNQMTK